MAGLEIHQILQMLQRAAMLEVVFRKVELLQLVQLCQHADILQPRLHHAQLAQMRQLLEKAEMTGVFSFYLRQYRIIEQERFASKFLAY